jgi:hypothetical protein
MKRFSVKLGWKSAAATALATAAVVVAAPSFASHAWGTYHWSRTSAQISPPIGDNVDSRWDSYLQTAVADWNRSIYIESPRVAGQSNPRNCRPNAGRIEVCNSTYGGTGWLGIAQIWLSGGHIVQGVTKLNDTYFNTAQYNTPAWRAAVTCQEIGHDYGLGHQDEDFNTDATTSCMEYTSIPAGNEHPDSHDYAMLEQIYAHTHSSSSAATASSARDGGNSPAEWGRPVAFLRDGRPNVYVREVSPGVRIVTHVTWAIGEGPPGRQHND